MGKTIKKIWNILTTVVICVVLVFAFLLAGVKIFGIDVFMVKSGSMEPEIKTGSVIYVNEIDSVDECKVGDIITFNLVDDTVATHRIVEIIETEDTASGFAFITKGDINDDNDPVPVDPARIIGKCVFSIPYIGYIFTYVRSTAGILTVVSVLMASLVITVLLGTFFPDEEKIPEKEKDENAADGSAE